MSAQSKDRIDSPAEPGAALASEFRSDMSVDALRGLFGSVSVVLNGRLPSAVRLIRNIALGGDTPATVDLLLPAGAGPHPVLIYLHGGAWVAGSPTSHRKLTARFAEQGFLVVSVDYRLAPEHPFPRALHDCVAAVYWAAANAARYRGDPRRLAIGGDSAGANLAAATAGVLAARLTAPKLAAALLIYGVFDMSDMGSASVNEFIHRAYLPGDLAAQLADPRISPIRCAHKLPPSFVVIGSQDALLPQSRQLRDALAAAAIPHEYLEERNMPHGFMQMELIGGVRRIVGQMSHFLHTHMTERRAIRWRRTLARVLQRFGSGKPARNQPTATPRHLRQHDS